jgi:hypothetical protein
VAVQSQDRRKPAVQYLKEQCPLLPNPGALANAGTPMPCFPLGRLRE